MSGSGRWDDLDRILEAGAEALAAGYLAEAGDAPSESPGDRIGRYRLNEPIGRGGMGTVWLAERADGEFEQRVAIKLVKRGMDTDEILARFRRERQILARLEHPHIARLIDGGAGPDGRPYFVMEHVEGRPITEHCDERRLGVEERLRLFVTVCRTVQHAHRNLIVHRDLKPSNVMVTGSGEVKLLDFGIARVLAEHDPAATIAGPLVLTPEYASPEQFRGDPVTTASDVYQLGALLYELLTGRPPGSAGARPGAASTTVLRPSNAVRASGETVHRDGSRTRWEPADVSGRRSSTPERLRRRLRGDLDAIVLAALRPDPEARPPSADAMADDVERHLDHRPILHGGGRVGYEARKFVRRHRIWVGSAALTIFVVSGLIAYYTVRLRGERDGALREAEEARVTADLVERFFEGWSPDAADRGQVTTEQVLADAARRADRELAEQPTALATALSVLGSLYTSLGATASAEPLLERALAIQERSPTDPDLATTLARRARLHGLRGEYPEAERALRRALEIDRRTLGPDHPETLRVQRSLAAALRSLTRFDEAETLLRAILAELGPGPPRDRSTLATETAVELGYVLFLQGRYDEAVALLRPALADQRARYGEIHYAHLYPMRALASSLRDRGDLEEAERLYREALEITRALFGEDHEQMVYATSIMSLVLQRRGELEEAELWARRNLDLADRVYGAGNMNTAGPRAQLAALRLERGDPGQAEPLLRQALDIYRRAFPDGHPDQGDALNRLAWIQLERGAADGPAVYREALAFDRARPPAGPHFVTDGYHYLAAAALHQGDRPEAEALYRRALALYRRQLPEGHVYRAAAWTGLGETLVADGRLAEAGPYLRQGLAEWRRAVPAAPERVAHARALLARATRGRDRRGRGRRVRRDRPDGRRSSPVGAASVVRALALALAVLAPACASPGGRGPAAWGPPRLEPQRIATAARLIAVHAADPRTAWVAGTEGTWGRTTDGGTTWEAGVVPGADSLQFRDVHAVDAQTAYLLSIGNGAESRIYRTDDGGRSWELQWTNPEPRAFYDCFAFWDADHGFAFSDAVDGVFPLIETRDGRTWTALPRPPPGREGEGSFAASGTCVTARGDSLGWFGTGAGPSARVFRTADRGRTWAFAEAPVAGGTSTTGIASVAFLDDLRGAAFGGDVGSPETPTASVAVTADGGRTWSLAGRPERPGAVYGGAFVPGAPTPTMVAVGPAGLAWSADFGATWATADTTDHWGVAFAGDGSGWAVGPGGRITRIRFGSR